MRDLKRTTVLGLIWETLGKILQQASSWIIYFALLKMLLPADFGLMAAALIVIGFFEYINELGLGGAIVQRKELDPVMTHTLFWLCSGIGALITILLWCAAPTIVSLYYVDHELDLPRLTWILRLLSLNLFLLSLRVVPMSFGQEDD